MLSPLQKHAPREPLSTIPSSSEEYTMYPRQYDTSDKEDDSKPGVPLQLLCGHMVGLQCLTQMIQSGNCKSPIYRRIFCYSRSITAPKRIDSVPVDLFPSGRFEYVDLNNTIRSRNFPRRLPQKCSDSYYQRLSPARKRTRQRILVLFCTIVASNTLSWMRSK